MENQNEEFLDTLSKVDKLYQHAYQDEVISEPTENKEENIDILTILSEVSNSMINKSVDLCVCERELECNCKEECLCDSDDYHIITSKKVILGTNCSYMFDFRFDNKVKLSKKKNLRFFTLNNETNEENPVMDLIRIYENKKLIDEKIKLITNDIQFPTFGDIVVKSEEIFLKLNYLLYEN